MYVSEALDRIEKLDKAGKESERDTLKDQVELAKAARTCQFENMKKITNLSELQQPLSILSEENYVLPVESARLYTKRWAEELLVVLNFTDWVSVIWPSPFAVQDASETFSVPIAKPAESWDWNQPCWSPLSAGLEGEESLSMWMSAFYNDGLLRLLTHVEQAAEGEVESSGILRLASKFIIKFDVEHGRIAFVGNLLCAMNAVLSTLRGLAAVLSPVPGFLGSKESDVEFISPLEKGKKGDEATSLENQGPVARLLAKRLKKQDFWINRISGFRRHIGAEGTMGSEFNTFLNQVAELHKKEDIGEDADPLFEMWLARHTEWEGFRAGALVPVSKAMALALGKATAKGFGHLPLSQASFGKVKLYFDVAKSFKHGGTEVEELRIKVQGQQAQWVAASRNAQLQLSIAAVCDEDITFATVNKFYDAVRLVMNVPKESADMPKNIAKGMWRVLGFATKPDSVVMQVRQISDAMKVTATDSDMKKYFDDHPDELNDMTVVVKILLSSAVCREFVKKVEDGLAEMSAKTSDYAGLLTSAYKRMMTVDKEGELKTEGGKALVDNALIVFGTNADVYKGVLVQFSDKQLTVLAGLCSKSAESLKLIAGGTTDGTNWFDSHNPKIDVMEHFANTLDKADTCGMETSKIKTEKAPRRHRGGS